MAKQRKYSFTPSEYQLKFFDWIEHGIGNAVVSARAGSGKTSTCVEALKIIPSKEKALFIAFNKSIAGELSERLKSKKNTRASTLHSLGLSIFRGSFGNNFELDEYKYRKYLKSHISELTTKAEEIDTPNKLNDYINTITMLIDYSRHNLAQSEEEIDYVSRKYGIPTFFDECVVTKKCLDWGKANVETIDYPDMIWLPVELGLKPTGHTYDWVFFDEAQDASLCMIQLFLKTIKRGGRYVAIGDEKQMINIWAGASEEAFKFLQEYPNTTLFTLPITYRCGKKIVEYANSLVPDICAKDDAIDGEVIDDCKITDFEDGDMVLCRSKAPLMQLYTKLLKKKINSYIKGQDIGKNLITILESVDNEQLNTDLDRDGVFVRLYEKLFNERNKLIQSRGLDYDDATLSPYITEMYDTINALMILGEKHKTKTKLIEQINKIFKEESFGVCLSTVHKSKGLESDNVYIICHSSMPSRLAVLDWEKEQERNLMYVAYTRARKKLGFVSEKEIKPSGVGQNPMEIINDLSIIERKVCKVLGKEPMERLENADLARFKLQNMTNVEDVHDSDNVVINIENNTYKDDDDLLSELEGLL